MTFVQVRSWGLLVGGIFQAAIIILPLARAGGDPGILALSLPALLLAPGALPATLSFTNSFPPIRPQTFQRCLEVALVTHLVGLLIALAFAAFAGLDGRFPSSLAWLCAPACLGLLSLRGLWKAREILRQALAS